jgi:putative ABC transport system ATP-binding protein
MSKMKPPIIRTQDLCKTYVNDEVQFHALRNVNLELFPGDFTVIMGSSGSGKSTLLYLLSGLDQATAGAVWFEEARLDQMNEKAMADYRRKQIGFVFQAINLVPNLTLYENVLIPGFLGEKDRVKVIHRAADLLKKMNLETQMNRLPSQVSGGEQQRAAIARAIINSPQVLFADEPTGNLNSAQGQNVLNILSELNTSIAQTVVMVTHDLKAACRANRIIFIKDGRIDGDLTLSPYAETEQDSRERQIFSYLTGKGW